MNFVESGFPIQKSDYTHTWVLIKYPRLINVSRSEASNCLQIYYEYIIVTHFVYIYLYIYIYIEREREREREREIFGFLVYTIWQIVY